MGDQTPLLRVESGRFKGRKIRLTDAETIIGRAEDAKIRIGSDDVSRKHCLLILQPDGIIVRDLGSRNGTFVDGRPIADEKLLYAGGTIAVGPMVFRLLGGETRAPKPDVKITLKSADQIAEPLSDDEIASWLNNDDSEGVESDTATYDVPPIVKQPPTPELPQHQKPTIRKKFASVAEEAEDIIRRHLESQQN